MKFLRNVGISVPKKGNRVAGSVPHNNVVSKILSTRITFQQCMGGKKLRIEACQLVATVYSEDVTVNSAWSSILWT